MSLFIRGLTLFGVFVLLAISLALVKSSIGERSYYRNQALNSVANSWTGEQIVSLPIFVVPYTTKFQEKHWNKETQSYDWKEVTTEQRQYFPLEQIESRVKLESSELKRGIFNIPVFNASVNMAGKIDEQLIKTVKENKHFFKLGQPYIALSVSDQRGISSPPEVNWQNNGNSSANKKSNKNTTNNSVTVEPGSGLLLNSSGFRFDVDSSQMFSDFHITFSIKGMSSFRVIPTANNVLVSITSNWIHPSFIGAFLPVKRQIDESGYQANWSTNRYSSSVRQRLDACALGHCEELSSMAFGVKQVNPVDHYVQSERSTKYGLLIILLIFVCFILVEVLKRIKVHFVHYLLVGFALTVFYLLLIALSEQLGFGTAYLIAAIACSALIVFYMIHQLGIRTSIVLGGSLMLTYGILYLIILSEDYAFITGSLLVFAALATVMTLTRKVNWDEWSKLSGKNAKGDQTSLKST